MNENEIVSFENVVKVYGQGEGQQTATDHVSFTIDRGEFVVILGQSGAGKSTVLNMLGGMDRPTEGRIVVNGREVSSMTDKELSKYRADTIGFIFQFYNLLPTLTAYENVALTKDITPGALDPEEMLIAASFRPSSPEVSSRESRSPGRWRRIRRSFWEMSPRVPWIPRPA